MKNQEVSKGTNAQQRPTRADMLAYVAAGRPRPKGQWAICLNEATWAICLNAGDETEE